MPDSLDRLLLDLSNSFTGNVHPFPDLLQCLFLRRIESEIRTEYARFPFVQGIENLVDLHMQMVLDQLFIRRRRQFVFQIIAQRSAAFFSITRRVE